MNEKRIPHRIGYITKFLSVSLLFSVTVILVGFISRTNDFTYASATVTSIQKAPVVVIDPGHGGEDGGALSESGIPEKKLNLTISKLCSVILTAGGYDVRLTRHDDRMVYDMYNDLENYEGNKKTYDLRNRVRFTEEADADVFVSIHLNKFCQPQYSGLQVYYSPNDPGSVEFAEAVKNTVKCYLQPGNERETKKATSSIFILKTITIPAILVECGFLSNPEELNKLIDPQYELALSFCLSTALQNRLN